MSLMVVSPHQQSKISVKVEERAGLLKREHVSSLHQTRDEGRRRLNRECSEAGFHCRSARRFHFLVFPRGLERTEEHAGNRESSLVYHWLWRLVKEVSVEGLVP